jgi:hypothetical protein
MTFTTTLPKANDSSWVLEMKWLMDLTGGGGSTPSSDVNNSRVTDDGGVRLTDDGGTRVVDV